MKTLDLEVIEDVLEASLPKVERVKDPIIEIKFDGDVESLPEIYHFPGRGTYELRGKGKDKVHYGFVRE